MLRQVFLFAFLLVTPVWAELGRFETELQFPEVTPQAVETWSQNYLSQDEIWEVPWLELNALMTTAKLPPELQEAVRESHLEVVSAMQVATVVNGTLDLPRPSTNYWTIKADLKEKLPKSFLAMMYQYLLEESLAPLHLRFKDHEQAAAVIASYELPPPAAAKLSDSLYEMGGEVVLFYTGDLSQSLNHKGREPLRQIYRAMTKVTKEQKGLKVTLIVGPDDDRSAIAEKYALGRDPKVVRRILDRGVPDAAGVTRYPLENLLPPFVRDSVGSFAACATTDCHVVTLNLRQERERGVAGFFDTEKDYFHLGRRLAPGEPLKVGDVIRYRDITLSAVHSVYYVGDGLVITKNGLHPLAPIVFQEEAAVAKFYEPLIGLFTEVIRPGEPFDPTGTWVPYRSTVGLFPFCRRVAVALAKIPFLETPGNPVRFTRP